MDKELKKELINYLSTFVSEKRKQRFEEVMSQRTGHLRIVLENMYQAHNASAVLRSCESFGVQHVHFIENKNQMRISDDVAMGSSNWINIHRHNQADNNATETLHYLKSLGFTIVATSPRANLTIEELPVDKKIAMVFGTEIEGITNHVDDLADEFVRIPMFGFTESFNVSVSAALCMYELMRRIRKEVPGHTIGHDEMIDIYYDWMINSVEMGEALVKDYLHKKKR